jgi:hypothetical protein
MKWHTPRSQEQPVSEQKIPASSTLKLPDKDLLRALTSLRQRNFRLFWFGQMISLLGSFMQIVGQSWLVLEMTHAVLLLIVVVGLVLLFGSNFNVVLPPGSRVLIRQGQVDLQACDFETAYHELS